MAHRVYKYTFARNVSCEKVEEIFVSAVLAIESLHGAAQVQLDAAHFLDRNRVELVIDARTCVGRDLNRLFTGYAIRRLGGDAFRVHQADGPSASAEVGARHVETTPSCSGTTHG